MGWGEKKKNKCKEASIYVFNGKHKPEKRERKMSAFVAKQCVQCEYVITSKDLDDLDLLEALIVDRQNIHLMFENDMKILTALLNWLVLNNSLMFTLLLRVKAGEFEMQCEMHLVETLWTIGHLQPWYLWKLNNPVQWKILVLCYECMTSIYSNAYNIVRFDIEFALVELWMACINDGNKSKNKTHESKMKRWITAIAQTLNCACSLFATQTQKQTIEKVQTMLAQSL
ncbi:hypothetical protein RFI_31039 [Reticulomyxa filosa]|uniref:Uncharacterized protein n=1 Tax=Reticulomyxa filosa TaxID=46433 RepID=X6LXN6_RETFI|nr:hypothetical protein RFI_31039 [Reticulomyxa filosa]|eukprot:ETO06359.1 hypothetical protein RFI_31039 [Reticulomyxa filosa]